MIKIIKIIPKSLYTLALIILLIVDAIGAGAEEFVKNIKISQVAEVYETMMANLPSLRRISEQYLILFIVATLLVLGAFLLKLLYKECLYVLAHFSFNQSHGMLGKSVRNNYWVKPYTLDQSSSFINGIPDENVLVDIDTEISKMMKRAGNRNVGYYGVSHIPLVFLAGYDFGYQSKMLLFHRRRQNDEFFEELSKSVNIDLRFERIEKQKRIKSNELIVAISTSFEITEDEINRSFGKDKHIVILNLNNRGCDQLEQYDSIDRLSNEAWTVIRKYAKDYKIEKIHLLISSSVGFTFTMGRKCSSQIDPQVIVYHYQNGRYTWGISINENGSSKHIISLLEDDRRVDS